MLNGLGLGPHVGLHGFMFIVISHKVVVILLVIFTIMISACFE